MFRGQGPGRPARLRGFSLVELLVVTVVIAILVGILLPAVGMIRNAARAGATRNLMSVVGTAALQFRGDRARLPGYFSQEEIGSGQANAGYFTQTENALLDLAGGVVNYQRSDGPDGVNNVLEVVLGTRRIFVDTAGVGSATGPGYLALGSANLGRPEPADRLLSTEQTDGDDEDPGSPVRMMPTLLDAWGNPIIMWTRNDIGGQNPVFADVSTEAVQSDQGNAANRRGLFYWWSHAGYLGAQSQGLRSVIGATFGGSSDSPGGRRKQLESSMDGILGHPKFPAPPSGGDAEGYREPALPRGDVVLHSAGRDGLFIEQRAKIAIAGNPPTPGTIYSVWYEGHQPPATPSQLPTARELPLSEFNDITQPVR